MSVNDITSSGKTSGYCRNKYRNFCVFGVVFPVKVPAIAGIITGTFILNDTMMNGITIARDIYAFKIVSGIADRCAGHYAAGAGAICML